MIVPSRIIGCKVSIGLIFLCLKLAFARQTGNTAVLTFEGQEWNSEVRCLKQRCAEHIVQSPQPRPARLEQPLKSHIQV